MENDRKGKSKKFSFAKISELYDYHEKGIHNVDWGIKGHNHPWIIEKEWKKDQNVLDVGAGYSDLANYLHQRYQVNAWVADNYGMEDGEALWSRWGNPKELQNKYPEVNYQYHNLGTESGYENLPENYFDVIYSVSAVEHIPKEQLFDVFSHMKKLLKPNSKMYHAIDIPIIVRPKNNKMNLLYLIGGLTYLKYLDIRGNKKKLYYSIANSWLKFLKSILNLKLDKNCKVENSNLKLALDPNILNEPPEIVFKIYPPKEKSKSYHRSASLLVEIEW